MKSQRSRTTWDRLIGSSQTNAVLFVLIVLAGASYILAAKAYDFQQRYVTFVPIAFMLLYASILMFARAFRLRDDQSGDNLYYMGFLFTLTSSRGSINSFFCRWRCRRNRQKLRGCDILYYHRYRATGGLQPVTPRSARSGKDG